MKPSQCLVSGKDFAVYFKGETAPDLPTPPKTYQGPERRANAHDRRWYAGQGGRRRADRKS